MPVRKRLPRQGCYIYRGIFPGNRSQDQESDNNNLPLRRVHTRREAKTTAEDFRRRYRFCPWMRGQLKGGKLTQLRKPTAPPAGFVERDAPEMVKFDKPGMIVAGVLVGYKMVEIERKQTVEYLISMDGKKIFKFLGVFDLVQKLTRADVGNLVRIEYLGETVVGDDKSKNPMKVFSVHVKPQPRQESAGEGAPEFPE
jgi:hypothetical protein